MEKSSGGGGGTALINLSFCSTNMLCSDWGQSDRRTKPSPPPHLPRTPSPPPSLTQHIHFYHVVGLSFFFFFLPLQVPGRKHLHSRAYELVQFSPSSPAPSPLEQREVTEAILQLKHIPDGPHAIVICRQKTCVCVTLDSGCNPDWQKTTWQTIS